MDLTVNCVDWSGRPVMLAQNIAEHNASRHPEMVRFLQRTCDVLEAPDFVYFRSRTQSHLFYNLGILDDRLYNTYMVVIVGYGAGDHGTVRNIYPTTQPASGDTLLEVRPRRGSP